MLLRKEPTRKLATAVAAVGNADVAAKAAVVAAISLVAEFVVLNYNLKSWFIRKFSSYYIDSNKNNNNGYSSFL